MPWAPTSTAMESIFEQPDARRYPPTLSTSSPAFNRRLHSVMHSSRVTYSSSRSQHEPVEIGRKRRMAIERHHMRDVLIRPHHHHAALVPIDAAHRKDVLTAPYIRAEHLFVVDEAMSSFAREQE